MSEQPANKKGRLRLILAAVVILVVAAVLLWPQPKQIVLTGIVTTDEVVVGPEIQGRVQELLARQGDTVTNGQLVALIQPQEWRAQMNFYANSQQQSQSDVTRAEAELKFQEDQTSNQISQAEASLAAAANQVTQGEADLENATLNFKRESDLYHRGVDSVQAFDQTRTAEASARARVDSLRSQVTVAQAAVGVAKASAQEVAARRAAVSSTEHQLAAATSQTELAKVRLDYTEVRAPTNGIVDVRAALQGEVVSPGQAILTIINPEDLWIRADVEETYVDRIKLGDKFNVRLPSGASREGTVFFRGIDADYATQRDVSRSKRDIKTFEVRLRCDNHDRALAVGMTAYVDIPLEKALTMYAVEVENLTKRFGNFTAVNGISFTVGVGEIFGLLGPNGAGKSTLIRMLTTLVPPTSGVARINGFDVVKAQDDVRRSIGVIPQAMTSDLELSAMENLTIFAKLYGISRERRKKTIAELLKAVDLEPWADKPVKQFSGGMRRRLEIARGLVHEPKIFFLDEPTTGLDPVSRVAVWEMLTRLKRERELTILVTTHYMDEADKLCDRIAIVDHGKLVALDSPLSLKTSVPGRNVLEVSFSRVPDGWLDVLKKLPEVAEVKQEDKVFRISTNNGPRTTVELIETARAAGVELASLSVQSTTLDDVFVYYTGHQMRDSLQNPGGMDISFVYDKK